MTHNQNLFEAQWLTVQADIAKALEELSALAQRLKARENSGLSRRHLKRLIKIEIRIGPEAIPHLKYGVVPAALSELAET